jgi:uncharacterized protein with FMN-binding domain
MAHHPTHSVARNNRRKKRNLLALGSAAVLTVYAAGYLRTSTAARKLAEMEQKRSGSADGVQGHEAVPARVVFPTAGSPAPVVKPSSPVRPAPGTPGPVNDPPAAAAISTPFSTSAVPVAATSAIATNSTDTNATVAVKRIYKDGAFYGWGYCRHGNLKVVVELKDDKITRAYIAECYTRYSQNVIAMLPGQVVARQSANVDRISRATESSDAFYFAAVEALKAAKL